MGLTNWRELLVDYVDKFGNGQYLFLDAGHYVHAWEPDLIAKEIDEFIKR